MDRPPHVASPSFVSCWHSCQDSGVIFLSNLSREDTAARHNVPVAAAPDTYVGLISTSTYARSSHPFAPLEPRMQVCSCTYSRIAQLTDSLLPSYRH